MVFANINGFWDPLNSLIGHMTGEGFIHTAHLVQPLVIDTAEAIVPSILAKALSGTDDGELELIKRM